MEILRYCAAASIFCDEVEDDMTTFKLNTYGLRLRIIPSINRYKVSHEINGLLRTNQYLTVVMVHSCSTHTTSIDIPLLCFHQLIFHNWLWVDQLIPMYTHVYDLFVLMMGWMFTSGWVAELYIICQPNLTIGAKAQAI